MRSTRNQPEQIPSVALIGFYPPPIGGISVHIKRLAEALREAGVGCTVYDEGGRQAKAPGVVPVKWIPAWLPGYLLRGGEAIVHYHGMNWWNRLALLLVRPRGARLVFTFHSFRDELDPRGPLGQLVMGLVFRHADAFVAAGPEIAAKMLRLGASPAKVTVLAPYLPPVVREQDEAAVPPAVWDFMKRHHPVIAANASRLGFFEGQDLYGVDMCIRLLAELRAEHPSAGLVFCLPQGSDDAYFDVLNERIADLRLEQDFLFVTEKIELYPILRGADVFVRPTNTDSYGISVAEALACGLPAVASDVCRRAEGALLFRSRDAADFRRAVLEGLQRGRAGVQKPVPGIVPELLRLYRSLASRSQG